MGCTGECPSDCNNDVCVGHVATCPGNTTSWAEALTAGVTLIKASHLSELETAINDERQNVNRPSRCAGTLNACGSNCPGAYTFTDSRGVGDVIDAAHWTNVAKAINSTPYNVDGNVEGPSAAAADPYVDAGDIITAAQVSSLRTLIETVESNCICDSYTEVVCACHPLCDTDGDPY